LAFQQADEGQCHSNSNTYQDSQIPQGLDIDEAEIPNNTYFTALGLTIAKDESEGWILMSLVSNH
jgi:hypothetical protein